MTFSINSYNNLPENLYFLAYSWVLLYIIPENFKIERLARGSAAPDIGNSDISVSADR